MQNLTLNLLKKKKKSLKSNILEAHKALKIVVVTISSHIISFHFLPISAQLKKTKIGRFEAEEVAVTGEKLFCLSQKERFLEPIEKNPYIVNYWWAEVSNYICSTILVITKIYIFLLYFTSVLLLIMRSQPASIAQTLTSTAAFYHCWSYTEYYDLWISALYIFDINIVCLYEICEFIWFWFDMTHYVCLILLIQLWATKIDVVLFLSSLILRKSG